MFEPMDAQTRGALLFVRFSATALIGLSLLEEGLYAGECFIHHQLFQILHGLYLALPFILGIVGFVQARAIADWISNKLDE